MLFPRLRLRQIQIRMRNQILVVALPPAFAYLFPFVALKLFLSKIYKYRVRRLHSRTLNKCKMENITRLFNHIYVCMYHIFSSFHRGSLELIVSIRLSLIKFESNVKRMSVEGKAKQEVGLRGWIRG